MEHYSPQSISSMAGSGPCNTTNIIGSSANCCMNISDQHHDVIFSANIKNCHHARISWKCQSVSVSSKKGKKLSKNKFILHHSHFVICFFMHKTWPFFCIGMLKARSICIVFQQKWPNKKWRGLNWLVHVHLSLKETGMFLWKVKSFKLFLLLCTCVLSECLCESLRGLNGHGQF